jgi:3-phenylpropionate/trans-cinnamate dioxygenase ferredoxin component
MGPYFQHSPYFACKRESIVMPPDDDRWIDISNFLGLKKGELADFDYEDKKIMIANINGEFFASDRVCTHAHVDLTEGFLDGSAKTVTCPLHHSSFDIRSGNALNLPAEDPLRVYRVKKERNRLLILF